ncbi:GNAT family N-acetyltransferase [Gynuella sunshinyii]|uniref:Acetyltransferase n=1 Tax=Gynuella sunshinyii YC6258 TaxID=1445510 RepID=A0A0C5V1N4_9GAMM|nr:GNAT family N-acetyltransferase [Gynuella sunshinyii]AJQ93460.1 acetyltransferase [Gynuella sunshinyii YC6258]
MSYVIRAYSDADQESVLSVWESGNRQAHPFLSNEFIQQVREIIPTDYLPNADTWVAEVDKQVVGFMSLLGHEVGALFVDPTYQGMGIGRALLDKPATLHRTLELEVFCDNLKGKRFYDLYGFEVLCRKPHPETGFPVYRVRYTVAE